jgi:3-oxoadipate enol-lactonase
MSQTQTKDVELLTLNWVRTGPANASTVLLIHPVGLDLTYWDRQIEALQANYDVVAFDLPGHGRSGGGPQDWSFDQAVETVAAVIGIAGGRPVHLVGISFGGMIAQSFVLVYPKLVRSLVLMGTASIFAEPVRAGMRGRAESVRKGGMKAVLQTSLERWFTPEIRSRRPDLIDRVSKTVLSDDPEVHAAIWEIIANFDVRDRLHEIACPTLILVGELDPSTPPSAASVMAERIPNARMVVLPNASHMIQLESPEAVNAELQQFFAQS